MPLRLRTERRALSRDAARAHSRANPTAGSNRAERRRHGWRGDVSTLVRGPHDRAWLYSGTINGGGQTRINAKRNARTDYWTNYQVQKLRSYVGTLDTLHRDLRSTLTELGPRSRFA
ncbi:hypothetical protein ACPC54_23545 [Kitasatospora sp. NPDC094028]